MNKDQNEMNGNVQTEKQKKLSVPTQIIFLAAVCALPFLNAIVGGGLPGIFIALIASAMNVLLALEFSASKPKLAILFGVNIIPFVGAYVYFGSLVAAFAALYPLALGLSIFVTVRLGLGRTASIACAAIFASALFFASYAILIAEEYGALNIETVSAFIDAYFAPFAERMEKMTYEENGETFRYFTNQMIESMMYYTKAVLVGTVAAVMLVFAYFATLAVRLLASAFGVMHRLPMGLRVRVKAIMGKDGPSVEVSQETVAWRIEIDSVTIGVYIISYIASVLLAPDGMKMSLLYIALQNLIFMLSPGFFYCGIRDIALGFKLKTHRSMFRLILIILGLAFLLIMPQVPIMIVCALGVIVVIRENRARKHMLKNRKG